MRDLLGNLVYNKIMISGTVNAEVNISTHPTGVYFIKIQTVDKVYTEKVVVQ